MSENCTNYETGEFSINQWVGLNNDECSVQTKERESAAYGEYILSNFRPCNEDCNASSARKIADQHPQMQIHDGYGWISSGGCKVDDDSNVRLGTTVTNPKLINQLFERPYLTVPYMGNGCFYPNDESELLFSDQTGEKRSCNVLSGVSINNYFTPMIHELEKNIQNPENLIEEENGWIRGGESTRKNLKEIDYKRVCTSSVNKVN